LSAISQRIKRNQKAVFSGLGITLVLLVIVILVSAFQRLWLYEQAYGFTRLRMYSHLFMIWLGFLLVVVVLLELIQKQRAFALSAFIAAVGFVVSLNLINVDAWIVNQNVKHTTMAVSLDDGEGERRLDVSYFYSLSNDSVPALIEALGNKDLPAAVKNELSAVLACRSVELGEIREERSWQSFHYSDERAWRMLLENKEDFHSASVYKHDGSWWVEVNNENHPCYNSGMGFD
jgi:hypothetical protein